MDTIDPQSKFKSHECMQSPKNNNEKAFNDLPLTHKRAARS